MDRYKVERFSIFFQNDAEKQFFTVFYYMEGKKILARDYINNQRQLALAAIIPVMIEMSAQAYAVLPSGVPSRVMAPIKLLTHKKVVQTQSQNKRKCLILK